MNLFMLQILLQHVSAHVQGAIIRLIRTKQSYVQHILSLFNVYFTFIFIAFLFFLHNFSLVPCQPDDGSHTWAETCCSEILKVKQSHSKLGQGLRAPAGWGSQISRQSAHEGGKVVSPTHRPPLRPPSRKYSWYSFLLAAESTPRP
jgi:hypothetical protein